MGVLLVWSDACVKTQLSTLNIFNQPEAGRGLIALCPESIFVRYLTTLLIALIKFTLRNKLETLLNNLTLNSKSDSDPTAPVIVTVAHQILCDEHLNLPQLTSLPQFGSCRPIWWGKPELKLIFSQFLCQLAMATWNPRKHNTCFFRHMKVMSKQSDISDTFSWCARCYTTLTPKQTLEAQSPPKCLKVLVFSMV